MLEKKFYQKRKKENCLNTTIQALVTHTAANIQIVCSIMLEIWNDYSIAVQSKRDRVRKGSEFSAS